SNRLSEVMKVLTIVPVVFLPLMLLTGIYGMDVPLPHFPGGNRSQFWWLVGFSAAITATMLMYLRRKRWV
ncbi:MAG TPA: CorA family divalent cation transporter, partial [Vicinamibacterales bacterium]